MNLNIKFFDPNTIATDSILFIIGRRGSGKSTVAEDIMSFFTYIKHGVCVSKTDKMNQFWTQHIPSSFIHHQFSDDIIYNLIKFQEKQFYKAFKELGRKPEPNEIEPAFAIFDDVTYDKNFLRSKATRELFMNGRHYNIFVLITCQYLMDMGPDLRNQVDYVILLKDNVVKNREKIYDYFAGVFPTYAAFYQTFRTCTEGREAMVINNRSLSYNVDDCIFFYQAKPNRQYRLCENDENNPWSNNQVKEPDFKFEWDSDDDEEQQQYIGMSSKDKERALAVKVDKIYPVPSNSEYGNMYKTLPSINYSTGNISQLLKPNHLVQKEKRRLNKLRNEQYMSALTHNDSINEESSDSADDDDNGFEFIQPPVIYKKKKKRRKTRKSRDKPEIFGEDILPVLVKDGELHRVKRTPSTLSPDERQKIEKKYRKQKKRQQFKNKFVQSQLFLV